MRANVNWRAFLVLTIIVIGSWKVQAQELSLAGVEKLIIVAPFAHVNLVSGAVGYVRASGSHQMSWSTRLDNKVLRLIGSASGGAKPSASVRVDVVGPGLPVEIHLSEGQIAANRWGQPVHVDLLKGKLTFKDSKANVTALVQTGSITLTEHQGTSRLELFRGDILAKNYVGDLEVSAFKVDTAIDKFQGLISLTQHQGNAKITGGQGTLRIDNSRANVAAKAFAGRVEGSTQEGSVVIMAAKEPEVHLKTQSGKITVSAPGSGALVSAVSEEGEVFGPPTLHLDKSKGARVLRGRLKGSGGGGRIELSAQAGSLTIRE